MKLLCPLVFILLSTFSWAEDNASSTSSSADKKPVVESTEIKKVSAEKPEDEKEKEIKKTKKKKSSQEKVESKAVAPSTAEEKVASAKESKVKEAKAKEGFTLESDQEDLTQTLVLKTDGDGCFLVEYKHRYSEVLSCKEPIEITYTKIECDSPNKQPLEIGVVPALITCEKKDTFGLHFRTKDTVISAKLQANRTQLGKKGLETKYIVKDAGKDTKFEKFLPKPELKEITNKLPDESPVEFKYSGFATIEHERVSHYGYDKGGNGLTAVPNFTTGNYTTDTFFSDINLSLHKDRTTLQSILEIGEIYFGDQASGGAEGARKNIVKVRNLYLDHQLSTEFDAKAGVINSTTDPRSFIYSDHTSAAHLSYQGNLYNALIWYGVAQKELPTATTGSKDQFISLQFNLNFLTGIKNTIYYVYRNQGGVNYANETTPGTFNTVVADSKSHWAGITFEYAGLDPLLVEASYIANWNRFPGASGVAANTSASYLADLKMGYTFAKSQITISAEGLMTPGAKAAVDPGTGNKVITKRKGFSSPVEASYLLTVATNDGVDDAPGTPKQSIIGNLSQDEGLRFLIGTISANLTKSITLFTRYGHLSSAAESSQNSKQMGQEYDLGCNYQATPATNVSFDFGYFKPGAFFQNRNAATLGSLKYKLTF